MSKKKSKKGKDSKFFSSNTKKGEIREILDELCNPKLDVQRDAIKRVIALMTVGKDVSMLFPQVVNCMQTSKYLLYPQSESTMMVLTPCSVGFNAQVSNKPTNKSSLKDLLVLPVWYLTLLHCAVLVFPFFCSHDPSIATSIEIDPMLFLPKHSPRVETQNTNK